MIFFFFVFVLFVSWGMRQRSDGWPGFVSAVQQEFILVLQENNPVITVKAFCLAGETNCATFTTCGLHLPDLDILSVVSVMKLTITGYSANIPSAAFHNQRPFFFLKCSHLGLALNASTVHSS